MKRILILSTLISLIFLLQSNQKNKTAQKELEKAFKHHFVYVPSGNFTYEESTVNINEFAMSTTEISNMEYQEFLQDLLRNNEMEKYKLAIYDSTIWNTKQGFNQGYVDYYFNHPAYRKYPVVCISKQGAQLFCEWLSHKYAELSGGDLQIEFRLPSHEEWVYAAKGQLELAPYAFGPRLKNAEGKVLCNFLQYGEESISRDSSGHLIVNPRATYGYVAAAPLDNADVTAPVKSYWPNGYGLYNMNGNVAEMVANKEIAAGGSWKDPGYDVRNASSIVFTDKSTSVGFRIVANLNPELLEKLEFSPVPKIKKDSPLYQYFPHKGSIGFTL